MFLVGRRLKGEEGNEKINNERSKKEGNCPPGVESRAIQGGKMKEVTKSERWDFVKDKNLTFTAYGDYPYTGLWKDRNGNIVAKDVPVGKHLGIPTDKYKYYISSV